MSASASFHGVTKIEFDSGRLGGDSSGGFLQVLLTTEGQSGRNAVTFYTTDPTVVDHFHDIARALQGPLRAEPSEAEPGEAETERSYADDMAWLSSGAPR